MIIPLFNLPVHLFLSTSKPAKKQYLCLHISSSDLRGSGLIRRSLRPFGWSSPKPTPRWPRTSWLAPPTPSPPSRAPGRSSLAETHVSTLSISSLSSWSVWTLPLAVSCCGWRRLDSCYPLFVIGREFELQPWLSGQNEDWLWIGSSVLSLKTLTFLRIGSIAFLSVTCHLDCIIPDSWW